MTGPRARVAQGDIRGLLNLNVESLVITLREGRRQPRGIAGAIDWRLNGRLSRLLLEEQFLGRSGERLLTPGGHPLRADRLFVFGVGDGAPNYTELAKVLAGAHARRVAIGTTADADAVEEASAWFGALRTFCDEFEEVVILEFDGGLRHGYERVMTAAEDGGFEDSRGSDAFLASRSGIN